MIDARYVGEELINILQHADLISESCVIDFKVQPHKKKQNCELYKDILALANEFDRPNQERWLIYGVEDKRHILVGVDADNPNMLDDSAYHEKLNKIDERVHFEFVRVPAEQVIGERGLGKVFAAFYIPMDNSGIIHEISSPVEDGVESEAEGSGHRSKGRRYETGVSFVRIGSATVPMLEKHRIKIRELGQRMHRYPYRGYTELNVRQTLSPWIDRLRILGSWDESNAADTRFVAELCGTSYQSAIESIRGEVELGLFTLRGPIWEVSDRMAALEEVGKRLVPTTLQILLTLFQKVMGSTDCLYEVPEGQRLMATARGVDRGCSPAIRKGVAAFCACLSANRSLAPHCPDGVIDNFIDGIMRTALDAESWSLLASNDCALPLLAEASPSLFLSAVERNTGESSSVTVFLLQKTGDMVSTDLGHGLVHGVSIAAMSGEHLALALKVLVGLSPYSVLAKDAIVRTLLPWMPMTNAPLKSRMGMGAYLASCGTAEAWTALLELLPNKTMNTLDQDSPAFLNVAIPSKEVPLSEYLEASKAYCQAVLEGAAGDAGRVVDIASNITCFASIGLTSEMANAVRRYCANFTDRERYAVWSTMQLYVSRCERYPHAKWALNEDDFRTIRELLHEVKPNDPYYEALYVCKTEDHALVAVGDPAQCHDSALLLRMRAIEASCGGGIAPLCKRLLRDGGKPRLLGEALGCLELGDCDQHWLLSRFEGGEPAQTLDELASAYCLTKYVKGRQEWVGSIEFEGWSERKIAGLFASLPCTRELWEQAEFLLADQSYIYWSLVQYLCVGESADEVMHCAGRLQSVGRAKDAIEYVYDALASGIEVNSGVILDAVDCVSGLDNDTMTEYYINELFKYVERVQPSDRLWVLEFQYAGVLENRPDAFLFRQMAASPQAFVEVVRIESGITGDDAPDDPHGAETGLLVHMHVLGKWVIVPGYDENGVFDASAFEQWLGEARAEARTRGFGDLADEEIGRNLFHATPNDEELFMPVPMLSFLDSCDSARDGYYRESFNYRGPHFVDQTGEEEEEIARSFDEKARVCEERGFVSFAITLRRIAAEYRREAKDNRGGEWFARL